MHRSPHTFLRLVATLVASRIAPTVVTTLVASFVAPTLATIALASAAGPALAAATEIRCPATLAQAPMPQSVPSDWIVRGAPDERSLQRAAFYSGDPGGLGTLAPDSTQRSGGTETSVWNFPGDATAPAWIGCLYRDGTAVVARPLPANVRRCETRTRVTALGDPAGLLSVMCN